MPLPAGRTRLAFIVSNSNTRFRTPLQERWRRRVATPRKAFGAVLCCIPMAGTTAASIRTWQPTADQFFSADGLRLERLFTSLGLLLEAISSRTFGRSSASPPFLFLV